MSLFVDSTLLGEEERFFVGGGVRWGGVRVLQLGLKQSGKNGLPMK